MRSGGSPRRPLLTRVRAPSTTPCPVRLESRPPPPDDLGIGSPGAPSPGCHLCSKPFISASPVEVIPGPPFHQRHTRHR